MSNDTTGLPKEISPQARELTQRLISPVERFLHIETSSGFVLLAAAVIALLWANSPWGSSYDAFIHLPLGLNLGDLVLQSDLHFVVNDILMVIFFFVVGLEIRLELYDGALSSLRQALLPLFAACGGVLVPAGIYLAFNHGQAGAGGWGVPMATDIAFAVGLLTLLGNRISMTARILLLAVAIIDDIVAILVIALFYSDALALQGLGVAGLGIGLVFVLQRIGARNPLFFVPPGVVIWYGALAGGLHPTVAGVILGLLTPAWPWLGGRGFLSTAARTLSRIQARVNDNEAEEEVLHELQYLGRAARETVSPALRLEVLLHPWVAFGILPLFALVNAGVDLGAVSTDIPGGLHIVAGILAGLVLGKPLGVYLFTRVAAALGWVKLPDDVSWREILVLGCVAGIGFTMSLFIGGLAFTNPEQLALAKLAILVASALAAALTLALARLEPRAGASAGHD